MVREAKRHLDSSFSPDGYNVGVNVGEAAGQTVMHLHIHLVPQYRGEASGGLSPRREYIEDIV